MKNWAMSCMMLLCGIPSLLMGQEITLTNSSFEDVPSHSTVPYGWKNCGDVYESPPDIQPGSFQVDKIAQKGKTYLGLVTRDNDTWEGVSQKLAKPIEAGQCYKFDIYLSKSLKYISLSKSSMKEENFNEAVRLRIWGGNSHCHKKEILAETVEVNHADWKKYRLEFNPTMEHQFIFIEAHYKKGAFFPYNGNLLVDNMSTIKECAVPDKPDDKDPPIAKVDEPKAKVTPPATPKVIEKKDVIEKISDFKVEEVKEGTVVRTEGIQFGTDKSEFEDASYSVLNEIYDLLRRNPSVVIEVGGHTNNIPDHAYCDQLSTARAKAVADYLVGKGISSSRIKYHGYGKRQPITTNETKEGRAKNQRVEIKILSLKG
jgi:outer membrane protein OmpA-like peptidoglycan-associated protein